MKMNNNIFVVYQKGRRNSCDEYYVATNKGLCYLSPRYSWEETFEFLKSKGHTLATKEKAIELLKEFNNSIEATNEENYTEWCSWIEEQEEEGYNTLGNFFDDYEWTAELKEYKRINNKLVTEEELVHEYSVNTLAHEWRHDLSSWIRMKKAEKNLRKWYKK